MHTGIACKAGTIYLYTDYRNGTPLDTVAQREEAITGLVYMTIDSETLPALLFENPQSRENAIVRPQRKAAGTAAVTYHRDVEPILQQRCQSCHRPGQVAPFSLLTYRDARNWSAEIKGSSLTSGVDSFDEAFHRLERGGNWRKCTQKRRFIVCR